jgi:Ni/Co efflux regulator RcnB
MMKKLILMMVFGAAIMMCIPANAKSFSDASRPEFNRGKQDNKDHKDDRRGHDKKDKKHKKDRHHRHDDDHK